MQRPPERLNQSLEASDPEAAYANFESAAARTRNFHKDQILHGKFVSLPDSEAIREEVDNCPLHFKDLTAELGKQVPNLLVQSKLKAFAGSEEVQSSPSPSKIFRFQKRLDAQREDAINEAMAMLDKQYEITTLVGHKFLYAPEALSSILAVTDGVNARITNSAVFGLDETDQYIDNIVNLVADANAVMETAISNAAETASSWFQSIF